MANGVTVLLIEDHSVPLISCQVYSRLGTREESAVGSGSSFIIADSVVNGASVVYKNNTGLALEVDETARAIVNRDFIGLLLRGSMDKLDAMVERAGDFANFDKLQRNFATERQRLVRQNELQSASQIGASGDSLRNFVYEQQYEASYGSERDGHSLPGGTDSAQISEISFLGFAAQIGRPDNLVVVVAGDFEPTYTMLILNRWFGHRQAPEIGASKPKASVPVESPRPQIKETLDKGKKTKAPIQPQPVRIESSEPVRSAVVERPPKTRIDLRLPLRDEALSIGFRVPSIGNPDFATLTVLATILGGGQSSRLARRFMLPDSPDYRANTVECNLGPYGATKAESLFSIYVEEPPSPHYSIWQSEMYISAEIERLKQSPVDEQELTTAKRFLLAQYRAQMESLDGRASAIAESFLRAGDPSWIEDYPGTIQAVTAADIRRVAKEYLVDANRSAVTAVPEGAAPAGK